MAEEKLIRNPKLIIGEAEKVEAEVVGADDIVVVTDEEFYTAKEVDDLLKKSGSKLPILTHMFSDHIINDISWLRADTFSWQSGDVYVAAYEHLANEYQATPPEYYAWHWHEFSITVYTKSRTPKVGDIVYYTEDYMNFSERSTVVKVEGEYIYIEFNDSSAYRLPGDDVGGTRLQNDTIDNIEIQYYTAEDGHKICLPDQESNLIALYEATGAADYYILDTTNKQFKLPRKQKRTLIQAVKNTDGTWYNLYSDGWVEQGGRGQTNVSVTLPIAMADSNYVVLVENHVRVNGGTGASDMTTTRFIPRWQQHNANAWGTGDFAVSWQVSGYAAESAYASASMRLEYYYVGNFEQDAVEQTAGLNAELFNGKADRNLLNTTDNVDIVIESQLPTADNNYTWYRKYKSGWVEQGGTMTFPVAGTSLTKKTITFPIAMADTNYTAQPTPIWSQPDRYYGWVLQSKTTTSMTYDGYNTTKVSDLSWFVCGMAA